MTIRFFVLQAHYRSTLDFSNEALQAAEKGLDRLMKAVETLDKLKANDKSTADVAELERRCAEAMADDLNSPMVISALFDWVRIINQANEGQQSFTAEDLERLRAIVKLYTFDILGLRNEKAAEAGGRDMVSPLVNMLLNMRMEAKAAKDWATSDRIRDELTAIGIRVKDRKDGFDWEIE
jgi:cysteinyl-tRNA synthetase